MDLETTIVAISSAPGNSNRALLRISGNRAIESANSLGLSPEVGSVLCDRLVVGKDTLPVLIGAFAKDASYTGDELVEIQFPGNQKLASMLVGMCVQATEGREASPGEFTARAFFSGRISLAQAEGVSATISASNNAELSGAALLRDGVLSKLVDPITTRLTRTLGLIEAGIDFTDEEDVVAISQHALAEELRIATQSIASILEHSIPMASLQSLPRVVLAGKPNAGKSTLFNAIVGNQRVVVDSTSGTTRDAIVEQVTFRSTEALLIDVAGLKVAKGELGTNSQESARAAIESADLILWCVEPGETVPNSKNNTIVVRTKADKMVEPSDAICAPAGMGVDSLCNEISNHLQNSSVPNVEAVAILPRHEQHLRTALRDIQDASTNAETAELCAACLRESIQSLGQISGRVSPDDILEHVFSTFCVGK